jgi:hypothetical protein
MRIGAAAMGLVLLALPAGAAPPLDIDSVAGLFDQSHAIPAEDAARKPVDDVLEIVKLAPDRAYVRVRLWFDQEHVCTVARIARVEGQSLVYRVKAQSRRTYDTYSRRMIYVPAECVLTLTPGGGKLVFGDKYRICENSLDAGCGIKGTWRNAAFDLQRRRPIRYMPRLLASPEYKAALEEAARK